MSEVEGLSELRTQPQAASRSTRSVGTSEEAHLETAHDITHQSPPRLTSVSRLQDDGVFMSPQTTQSSNARAVALYPKLAREYLKVRESTFDAQQRLAQMEQQLAKASEQIRQFFARAVGEKPAPIALETFPEPATFPPPASNEVKAQLAEDPAFLERYSTLRQQEAALARHLAQVETWLQRANLAWVELSRLPSASKRPSTPVSGLDLVRKRRKVQGTPTAPASICVRPDSTKEAQAVSARRTIAELIPRTSTSIPNALAASTRVISPATPEPKAEPRSSGSSRRALADTTLQAPADLLARTGSNMGARQGGSPVPEEAAGQDENVAPRALPKASPRMLDVKNECSPSPRTGSPASPRPRVPSRPSTTPQDRFDLGDRPVKVEPKSASSPASSPRRPEAWSDLDALTPPAVDEETRKKLKKRNQLKRKRQREA